MPTEPKMLHPPVPVLISAPRSTDMAALLPLTFPSYRSRLSGDPGGQATLALAARVGDTPVGLLLADGLADPGADPPPAHHPRGVHLLSVCVAPTWRRSGIAAQLMQSLEDTVRQRGGQVLTTSYTTRMPAWQAFERLLASCHWASPQASLLMSQGRVADVLASPTLSQAHEAPPGFELFEWSQLRAEEVTQLQHDVASGAIPETLSPFADVEEIEPGISVGLRHQGAVVAWMIVTRSPLVQNALCYRSLFVHPQLRAAYAFGPLVLAHALHRHNRSAVKAERPVGVFGMSVQESTKMINFFRKRLNPYCFCTYESRSSVKPLN